MSKKRTKQYLMLLMVIGLVSIAAGNSGTFASFNAEVTNAGNTFATGSLFLHDTTGGQTCTSESASGNLNDGTNGDTCHTIFSVSDNGHAQYADLTLQNAGSIDASGIKVALGSACANGKVYESNTTLSAAASVADTTITVHPLTLGLNSGAWLYLDDGAGNHEEVQVTNGPYAVGATSIDLASGLVNAYTASAPTTNVESSPQFSGGADLCAGLDFNITETDSSFTTTTQDDTGTAGALGCAYGPANLGSDGCDFSNSSPDTLATVSTTATPLTLQTTPFGAGESRYFVLGIKPDSSFGNAYQDEKATFDLVWHIDQA